MLVYVPGLDGTGQLLFKQIPDLSTEFRVATFRLRENGRFTYSDLVEDVASIVKDAGEDRAVVLGESFGGTIALQFAIEHPYLVDRLVIVNSFSRYRPRARLSVSRWLVSWLPGRFAWLLRFGATRLGLWLDGVEKPDRERFFEAIRTVNLDAYVRRLELISDLDLDGRLSRINVPTLFIAAERDLVVPSVKEARFMASRVSSSTLQIVKGAGHGCLLGNRVSLLSVLAGWMKQSG